MQQRQTRCIFLCILFKLNILIQKHNYNVCFIKGLLNRVRIFAIVHSWFTEPAIVKGPVLWNNLYSFTHLMWHSTWILRLAIFWLSSTWDELNWPSAHKKWGVAIVIPVPSKQILCPPWFGPQVLKVQLFHIILWFLYLTCNQNIVQK